MPSLRPRVNRAVGSGRRPVSGAPQDSLLSAIVKWIPIEILTLFKTVDGLIPATSYPYHLRFAIFVTAVTPLWIAYATSTKERKLAWRQIILSPLAFGCWAAAILSDSLAHAIPAWEVWMGSVVLGVGTFLLPIFDGILARLGVPQE